MFGMSSYTYTSSVQDESGEVTPVSGGSEIEFNTNDATAGSTADCDVTVTEDIESLLVLTEEEEIYHQSDIGKPLSPITPSISSESSISPSKEKRYPLLGFRDKTAYKSDPMIGHSPSFCEKDSASHKQLGSDKWGTSKEKFLEIRGLDNLIKNKQEQHTPLHGAIVIKESYIEPPKINRISKSFHGQPNSSSFLDVSSSSRRASDVPLTSKNLNAPPEVHQKGTKRISRRNSNIEKTSSLRQFVTQKSLTENVPKNPRFTTTLVDEAEHAALMGISPINTETKISNTLKK
ncbi:hypothetical protein MML48_2g00014322 [Holotrichia oblita]|uniref:Uncharacterized protein n=1 Tax=Holotrichia oblita TaxID=644536 RepID=A0ACB9TMB5_HOLOL|nr:hypothetical protein MML48_2g00014322 [Holotrichia oblita]